jgi:hypothetical protein
LTTKTTTTVAPPSPEEKAYLAQQTALAQKQMQILDSQSGFQQSYLDSIKPLLDEQSQYMQQSTAQQGDYLKALQPSLDAQTALLKQSLDQQTAALNDPVQKEIQQRANEYLLQQMQDQTDLAPLQKQLLQTQLDQAINGNKPTQEQLDSIDQASKAAYNTGISDINSYSEDSLRQLRDNLAPSLGLRPGDTPILDRGALVTREANRQAGQLTSNLAEASANARLNIPLASQQVSNAVSGTQAGIADATRSFQASLADAAAQNRLRLLGATGGAFSLGLNGGGPGGTANAISGVTAGGIGLADASRSNPLSFARGGTSTKSDPWGTAVGLIGGIGSALSGTDLGSVFKSDARVKDDIQTDHYDNKGRRWVRFTYKGDSKKRPFIGVIAQEVERTDPEAVLTNGLGLKFVDYSKITDGGLGLARKKVPPSSSARNDRLGLARKKAA